MNRLIFVLPNAVGGGLERNVVLLQRTLQERNIELTCHYYAESNSSELIGLIQVVKSIYQYRKENIIVLSGGNINNLKVGLICFFTRSRHIILQRNIWSNEPINFLGSRYLYKILYELILRRCQIVLANSYVVLDDIAANFPFVNINVLYNIMEPKILNEKYKVEKREYFISIGSNRAVKNYQYLIELWMEVKSPHKLKIVGKGVLDLRENLSLNVWPSNVELVDYSEDILDMMINSKGLIHTSLSEGYSNVLLNGALLDIPVLSTKCGGSAQEVLGDIDYLTGELYHDVDILSKWLNNPRAVKAEWRNELIERHKPEAVVTSLMKFID